MYSNCPGFVWPDGAWTATLPARPWTPRDATVGGVRVSSAGVPASYVVRRDFLLDLTVRVRETEWVAFYNFLIYGQTAEPFTWRPDYTDTEVEFEVYLESPAAGEQIAPKRAEFARLLEVDLVLRGEGAAPWREVFE